MEDLSDYYRILGLKAGASLEEVKQSYRDLVKVWHPDRFSHDERLRQVAQEKLKEINGAYKVLQAHFFEAGLSQGSVPPPEPDAAQAATPDEAVPRQNRAMIWVMSGLCAVLATLAAVWFASRPRSHTSVPGNTSAPVKTATGASQYALFFNGDGGHVDIATTGSLGGTFTVECWAMSQRPKIGGTVMSSRGPDDFGFDIKLRQGKRIHGDIGDGRQWLVKMANAGFSYNGDLWYHIAYVVTPTNYMICINGKRWKEGVMYPAGNPLLYDARHQLCLGFDKLDPGGFEGCIAEVRIWNTARTAQQIKDGLNVTLTGDEPGLQACWRFTEGAGNRTIDSTSHRFVATLVGNVSWTTNTPVGVP